MDTFAVQQLVKLEQKVPSIKKQPSEVVEMLQDGRNAVYTHLSEGKQAVYTRISDGKQAISTRLNNGKEAISSTIASGKDALYTHLQSGSEALANTRAGALVGCGVDHTLSATENVVEYLLPPEESEEEVLEPEKSEKEPMYYIPRTRQSKGEAEEEKEGEAENPDRFTRVKTISRKVKVRVYYRSLRKLQTVQQQCKCALEQLKVHIDLVSGACVSTLFLASPTNSPFSVLGNRPCSLCTAANCRHNRWFPNTSHNSNPVSNSASLVARPHPLTGSATLQHGTTIQHSVLYCQFLSRLS